MMQILEVVVGLCAAIVGLTLLISRVVDMVQQARKAKDERL